MGYNYVFHSTKIKEIIDIFRWIKGTDSYLLVCSRASRRQVPFARYLKVVVPGVRALHLPEPKCYLIYYYIVGPLVANF